MNQTDELKSATRLARTIASDISIYYGEKIKRGLENDTLFEEIKGELREGVTLFESRVSPEIVQGTNVFEEAIIDIIVASRSHVRTPIF